MKGLSHGWTLEFSEPALGHYRVLATHTDGRWNEMYGTDEERLPAEMLESISESDRLLRKD